MNCCGGHESHKESEGKNSLEHKAGRMEGTGGSKISYLVIGLVILLAVIFIWKYFK